jgi:pyridoxamine 5'-phosphate oxidase
VNGGTAGGVGGAERELDELRHRLETAGLRRADLDPDPFVQFTRWFDHARDAGLYQPEAFALATSPADGAASARLVLLRGFDARGFVFFTNRGSRKGDELAANPRGGLVFPWQQLARQVRATGPIEPVDEAESDAYFASRPRGSQISAWASPQSDVVHDRDELDARRDEQDERWAGRDVERPPFWGGYRLVPEELEFWQGRINRFHDRFRYRPDGRSWIIERLAP